VTRTATPTVTTTPAPGADLSVVKTGATAAGDLLRIDYTLAVSNGGPATATNVVVTDPLPAGVTFVSASSSQGSCSGTTTVVCSLGTLAPGAGATIHLAVRAASPRLIVNTATVGGDEPDPDPTNDTSTKSLVAGSAEGIPALSPLALAVLALALVTAALVLLARPR
jgi:uncharacterized repeat protein (TIGR01451 family)